MKHLDLFSGIGGFSLAASWVWGSQHELVSFCERDEFCQKVLKKHWPSVPCVDDIHNLRGNNIGTVDLLTGGFPCQPFSSAGKQQGKNDDRYLWPEMRRIIEETQPNWIVGENVAGIVNLALDDVLIELEDTGYEVQPFIIPACALNAPHKRDRVWIIANAKNNRRFKLENLSFDRKWLLSQNQQNPDNAVWSEFIRRYQESSSVCQSQWTERWIDVATRTCRMDDGLPRRVERIRSLGNAIVPQVAAVFFEMMKRVDWLYNMN